MNEDISIVNKNTRHQQIINFFKNNLKKIVVLFLTLLLILIFFFGFQEFKNRKKIKLSEKYNNIAFSKNLSNTKLIKDEMIEIINAKDHTYSTLALYYILDNELIDDQNKINGLFDKIISINKNDNKYLIIYKKALYNSDKLSDNEILSILQPVINSESIWKQHALLLMADIYFQKKQLNKSREFLNNILTLETSKANMKQEVKKRLNRDFSE